MKDTWCPSSILLLGRPLDFVISANLKRRHLDVGQRAAIADKLSELSKHGGDRKSDEIKTSNDVLITQTKAAALMNVGVASVQRAATVRKKNRNDKIKPERDGLKGAK